MTGRPGAHRAPVRPRYGRLAVLGASLAVTMIAVLGSMGLIASSATGGTDHDPAGSAGAAIDAPLADPSESASASAGTTYGSEAADPTRDLAAARTTKADPKAGSNADVRTRELALPTGSGSGRRVVFSEGRQRVWLVDDAGRVRRTYLVSGSVIDNLDPGTYSVYSRSRWAVGVDDSGVMEYFARFTQGPSGAAIGFHTIPTKAGEPLQTQRQLGTPQSHGCIRQRTADAIALWEFAPIGTTVVVTA